MDKTSVLARLEKLNILKLPAYFYKLEDPQSLLAVKQLPNDPKYRIPMFDYYGLIAANLVAHRQYPEFTWLPELNELLQVMLRAALGSPGLQWFSDETALPAATTLVTTGILPRTESYQLLIRLRALKQVDPWLNYVLLPYAYHSQLQLTELRFARIMQTILLRLRTTQLDATLGPSEQLLNIGIPQELSHLVTIFGQDEALTNEGYRQLMNKVLGDFSYAYVSAYLLRLSEEPEFQWLGNMSLVAQQVYYQRLLYHSGA